MAAAARCACWRLRRRENICHEDSKTRRFEKLESYHIFVPWRLRGYLRASAHSGVTYAAVIPPSTVKVAPVVNDDSSEARNSADRAISTASPKRPIGM